MSYHGKETSYIVQRRKELVTEKRKLQGLMDDTRSAIGEVASHNYDELNQQPPKQETPVIMSGFLPYPNFFRFGRFFYSARVVRATEEPKNLLVINEGPAAITQTATETYDRRRWIGGYVDFKLPAPPEDKRVVVNFSYDHDHLPASMDYISVSVKGNAYHDTLTADLQAPTKPVTTDKLYLPYKYFGPSDLIDDYAASFTNALGVTEVIATSLDRIHGIGTDIGEVKKLQAAWQQVSPQELHPGIAVLLPKKR